MSSAHSAVENTPWQFVCSLLPADWRETAVRLGFLSRTRRPPGAVVDAPDVQLRAMLHLLGTGQSLRISAAALAAGGLIAVSHVAIHKWLRKAPPFFSFLLLCLFRSGRDFAVNAWAGYIVRAVDATTVQRPGATQATARVHYCLRLDDMTCDWCSITDETGGESLRNFPTAPGVLDIGDRGYSNPPSIAAAVDQGGDVLVRWNPPSLPVYDSRGRRRDFTWLIRGLRVGRLREHHVTVRPAAHKPIQGRIVITRLRAEDADKARARLRRERGTGHVTPLMLRQAGFVMLFTTVPADRLDTEAIARLYSLRWQIELKFKREKSVGGLDQLPNFRPDTVRAWILGKLILSEISRRLSTPREQHESKPHRRRNSRKHEASSSSRRGPSPWERAKIGAWILSAAFLPFDWLRVGDFLEAFDNHLQALKRHERIRQIPAFLRDFAKPADDR